MAGHEICNVSMIQNLCSVISISDSAEICYQTVKFLKMNDKVINIPNPFVELLELTNKNE